MGLKGKTAIVTGSTRGIGKACALLLAEDGANVLVNGRGVVPPAELRARVADGSISYRQADGNCG